MSDQFHIALRRQRIYFFLAEKMGAFANAREFSYNYFSQLTQGTQQLTKRQKCLPKQYFSAHQLIFNWEKPMMTGERNNITDHRTLRNVYRQAS